VASDAIQDRAFKAETARLRAEANLLEALNRESGAANQRRAAELGVQIAASQQDTRERQRAAAAAESAAGVQERAAARVSRAIDTNVKRIETLTGRIKDGERSTTRFGRAMERLGVSTSNAGSGLRGLSGEFRGLQLALVIKYAQSLISVLAALAAQLVAVAAAAGQAAVGIGAALGAGIAQAIPVVGVLAAAFARLTSILKAVKLQNQQQITSTHDAANAARAQSAAAEQVRSAQERVADAHRNTQRAQEDLTRTRKDAIRTVEDLITAERSAVQQLEEAQGQLRSSQRSGDVAGTAVAFLSVESARRGVTRAREDAAPVRARGVEGLQTVVSAQRSLNDAKRAETRANEDLTRTREQSADTLDKETAAVDRLADMLKLLSPAERELYGRILRLQDVYKRVSRPITDIITRAFSDVVDRITGLLQDPRILRGFRNIATEVAHSIRQVTGAGTGRRSVNAFQVLTDEAARNIPTATRIFVNFFSTVRSLVLDAVPAFRTLLGYVDDYVKGLRDFVERNPHAIRDFFSEGVEMANSFFKLGLAVVELLFAIAGPGGGADEGRKTVEQLTDAVNDLTRRVRRNADQVRDFFSRTRDVLFEVLGVLGNLAATLLSAFSERSVKAFADFLNRVMIPALGDVIEILGAMATLFHQLFALPGFAEFAQFAATLLLLAKGLTVIRLAIVDILQIVPNFLRAMGLMAAAEEATGLAAVSTFGWIVLAIAAVVAAVILLDRHFHFLGPTWRWLKNAAGDVFAWLKQAGQDVVDWFSDVWNQGLLKWVRAPFVALARIVADMPFFRGIVRAAERVVEYFSSGGGKGVWAGLKDALLAPFHGLYEGVRLLFRLISTIVQVFLDLLAGRFDAAGDTLKGFFNDLVDTLAGAATSFLSIMEKILGTLGKIPKIGGPFKAAADAIRGARTGIDEWRESLRDSSDDNNSAADQVERQKQRVDDLRKAYAVARDEQSKYKKGTDDYRVAAEKSRQVSEELADAVKLAGGRAKDARRPVSTLRSNIADLGDSATDTTELITGNLNEALRAFGAKQVHITVKRARRAAASVPGLGDVGAAAGLATGGVPNMGASSLDDHLLIDPYGHPVAAMSGSEGVVNRPQMGVIDYALGGMKAMGALPWGSLNELWGSGLRHYANGGDLKPAIRTLSNRLDRMFGLQTTSTTGDQHAPGSFHYQGLAADVSGAPSAMSRAVRYIMSSGIWRSLLEGIHNPGLSIKNGQRVPPSFWGSSTWADHADHLHLAVRQLTGALGDAFAAIRRPRVSGPEGPLRDVVTGMARRQTRAANRYLQRVMDRMGGGDARAMGADANVVSAFRRAMRLMGANRTERLAGWEAGIVESGLRNLPYGDRDSLGALQERAGIYGRSHALNPFASMVRFLTDARSRRPWRGSAGALAQAVQRSAFPGRYDAVRGRAMRYLQGGGTPGRGGGNPLALRIQRSFTRLTEEGGVLDQLTAVIENIATRGALALQRLQFRTGAGGPRRRFVSPVEQARLGLRTLRETGVNLAEQQGVLQNDLAGAQAALTQAQKAHNRRAAAVARAAINNLRARLSRTRRHRPERAGPGRGSRVLPAGPAGCRQPARRRRQRPARPSHAHRQGARRKPGPEHGDRPPDRHHAHADRRAGGGARQARRSHNAELVRTVRADRRAQRADRRGGRPAVPELDRRRQQHGATADDAPGPRRPARADRRDRLPRIAGQHARRAPERARQPARGPGGAAGPGGRRGQHRSDRQPDRPDRRARHHDGREHAGHQGQHRRRLQRAHRSASTSASASLRPCSPARRDSSRRSPTHRDHTTPQQRSALQTLAVALVTQRQGLDGPAGRA
jgi:hypothetical protein